jgi:RHS repeat-associated protein
MAAVQNNLETPVLQLTNLHGDIIATAYKSETATALASKADTSEFGVPTTSLPPKYSWLGALELPTELPSGVIAMGARSYVPQLGRFLQPDPIPGGSANAYTYTYGNPVNSTDPTGEYTATAEAWAYEGTARIASAAAAVRAAEIAAARAIARAAEEAAARVTAEEGAQEASWSAYWAAGTHMPGEGEEEEGGEEEWYEEEEGVEEEYASYHPDAKPAGEEAHVESATLYQPLVGQGIEGNEGGGTGERAATLGLVPLCKEDSDEPCGRAIEARRKFCKNGLADNSECRGYLKKLHHNHITVKDLVCGGVSAGAGLLSSPGGPEASAGAGFGAGLACVLVW